LMILACGTGCGHWTPWSVVPLRYFTRFRHKYKAQWGYSRCGKCADKSTS
jgi:hypothetical protein